MNSFTVTVPDGRLDLPMTVNSGQVFRWREVDGAWLGSDGSDWYRVRILHADRFEVSTNRDSDAFSNYFRLDWDASAIENEILRNGPELEPHMDQLRGLRLLRPRCAVEAFYGFLCTPNNNVKRITQMNRYLAGLTQAADVGGIDMFGYPHTEQIAALEESLLRAQMFGYRAATIPSAAQQVLNRGGDAYIESLRDIGYVHAYNELLSIKGIGPKLADCICLFGLDHTEAVPVDTHIWQAATRLFFPQWQGLSLTETRYRAIGDAMRDRFGKLAGWAQQYLFYENMLNWRSR